MQKILNKQITYIKKLAEYSNKKKLSYSSSKYYFDKKLNSRVNVGFDLGYYNHQNKLHYINKFNYIHSVSIKNDMIPIFVTLTLPSVFHQYRKNRNTDKIEYNPHYGDYSIAESTSYLNLLFTRLTNGFTVNGEKIKLHFIKVVEPHKNLTPHIHAVIYVPSFLLEKFDLRFERFVDYWGLEQFDYTILSAENYSIQYLLKYTLKTLENDTFYQGWRIFGKVRRVVSYSPLGFSTKEIRSIVKLSIIPYDESSTLTYYEQIESKVTLHRNFYTTSKQFYYKNGIDDFNDYINKLDYVGTFTLHASDHLYTLVFDYIKKDIISSTYEVEFEDTGSFQGWTYDPNYIYYESSAIYDPSLVLEDSSSFSFQFDYDIIYHSYYLTVYQPLSFSVYTLDGFILKDSLDIIV